MKKNNKKIEVSFNSHQFNLEKDKLEKVCEQLNDALNMVTSITDGNVKVINVKEVSDYLNNQTNFKNARMSAEALNVAKDFEAIKQAEKLLNNEFIIYENNAYKANLSDLKEFHTSYLTEQATKQYEALNEACNILKTFHPVILQSINTNWSVDVIKLSNISNYLRAR